MIRRGMLLNNSQKNGDENICNSIGYRTILKKSCFLKSIAASHALVL
jgi:hypothetical protein